MKIILSRNAVFGATTSRVVMVVISILLIAQSSYHLVYRSLKYDLFFFLDLIVLFGGGWFLIVGLFILSKRSKYVPRVEISDESVLIHNQPFGKSDIIDLKNISKIRFGSFEFTFYDKQGSFNTYRINTRKASESLKIKEELRKVAAILEIEVDDEISAMVK